MNAEGRAPAAERPRADELAEAFAWFARTTERLQTSHRELRGLARALGDELAAKNAELEASLADRERAERFLSTLLDRLTNGVVVLDAAGAVVLANPKAEQLLGRSAEDLRGGGLAPEIARIADEGEARVAAGGEERVLCVKAAEAPGPEGAGVCKLLVLEDATWRKTLEGKLERAGRLAAMGEMAATVAHELRNPLGSIELFASMLCDDLRDLPEQRALARQISEGVARLNRVASSLLQFTQSPRPRLRDASLSEIVDGALRYVLHVAELSSVVVQRDVPACGAPARVDPDLLGQVVMNLAVNAIEAMEERGGALRVEVRESPPVEGVGRAFGAARSFWRIRVEDQGKGMSAEERARIFDPFYTTKSSGTGLGLAISDRIVAAHGGFIDVASEPGRGSVFTIYLPREAA